MLGASAIVAVALMAGPALAQDARSYDFDMPTQPLTVALKTFGATADQQLIFSERLVQDRTAPALKGAYTPDQALTMLLAGSGLVAERTPGGVVTIRSADAPQSGSASDGADGTVEALIVTAQKREEDIQDVPIAISAFTQEDLTRSQIAGGPDLMTQVPNFTFTKTNFSGYSIQIRGIGTQAISATTDAAVAVALNNTPFIRNRFFEQEFFDLERVEVLRGPQGTLYGRNATAGVVNIITAKPKFSYEARLSADISNYSSTRLEGMVNVPLVEDKVALRLAGAWTKRDGYVANAISGSQIDGRDLWSTRLSLRIAPAETIDVNLIWEHFNEDDDRLRSGKQLCKRSLPPAIGQVALDYTSSVGPSLAQFFSQGCEPASLYSTDSFEVPVGQRLPYYGALHGIGLPTPGEAWDFDPYANTLQSRDLRSIESTVDPQYRAKSDLLEIQAKVDLSDALTLASETSFQVDNLFSLEDFNRFNTRPGVFIGDSGSFASREQLIEGGLLDENGTFCDPQIGCADRLVVEDVSTAKSRQFSQEFRLSSAYDGPANFSLGANFLRYDTEDKYYVFANSLTLTSAILSKFGRNFAAIYDYPDYVPNVYDNSQCLPEGGRAPRTNGAEDIYSCIYIDPNPIESLNDRGHNYFLSKNPYKLISYAAFGELYYQFTDTLKFTGGFRWTVDRKEAPRIPSWLFAANSVGYPVADTIRQTWREPTGRLTLDWKPDVKFTDETLLYASYAHGYKAGGANPPPTGVVMRSAELNGAGAGYPAELYVLAAQRAAASPRTFEPEFVNAFEVGAKNTLFGSAMTLNVSAFYYDYQGYQISQIVDRSALNLNFDARIWGGEIEADWRPLENLRLGFKGGYESTEMADGSRAIDTIDRTAGDADWFVTGPFPTFPSNCVLPVYTILSPDGVLGYTGTFEGALGACEYAYVLGEDPNQNNVYPGYPGYDALEHPEINGGAGFFKDLSGNELPNAPHFTATITADYTLPLPNDWLATLHTDLYYQSEAWTRVFNTEGYDKLKAYTNVNIAAIFTNDTAGWKVMAYVKNVFDRDSITGAFLNSDDTGLTTNVFLNEPRLYGLRVTKEWSGGPWWTGANPNHAGPFPLTIEVGGQTQRHDAPAERLTSPSIEGLSAGLNTTAAIQGRDLDWGDGRSLRVAYQPTRSDFGVSASLRRNRVNSDTARLHSQHEVVVEACALPPPLEAFACDPAGPLYRPENLKFIGQSWSDTAARAAEQQVIGDLNVTYRLNATPVASRSRVGMGLRYAEFRSDAVFTGAARDGWIVAAGWYLGLDVHDYTADVRAKRTFRGGGPTVTWESARTLWGGEAGGRVDIDWSVTGGVLFGEQEASIIGEGVTRLGHTANSGDNFSWPAQTVGEPTVYDLDHIRSKSASVPLADLALGLSYEIDRVRIGAGYRWERYFDVLDTGYEEHEAGDRTMDGPYFRVSVGFGR